jgi:probable HAF family extracellular repeat protein
LWREETGATPLPFASSSPLALSGDGQVVAGELVEGRPFWWSESEGISVLPSIDAGRGGRVAAIDLSGSRFVGWAGASDGFPHAAFWQAGLEPIDLGSLGSYSLAHATNVSGTVVVGEVQTPSGTRPFKWTHAAGMQLLPVSSSQSGLGGGIARAVSADGAIVAGEDSTPAPGFSRAVIWRTGTPPEDLGTLGESSFVTGMSYDGTVVVGWSRTLDGREPAFLWTQALGMVELGPYLTSLGVDLFGWQLGMATGISGDGSTIIGLGAPVGGWMVKFPHPPSQCVFSVQPISVATPIGSTAQFSSQFVPDGHGYQWRRNGVPLLDSPRIVGTATATLQVLGVSSADQGTYDCTVSGTCGTATSTSAELSCRAVISGQPDGGPFFGGNTIVLTAAYTSSGSTSVRWKKDNINLFNSGAYSGVTTPTLTIHANDPSQSGSYTLAITNPCGVTTTEPAIVSVSCAADWNHDGGIDGDDVILFFQQWDENDIGADFTADGSVDGDDVIGFFGRWDLGC